jgi:hypothetical protein
VVQPNNPLTLSKAFAAWSQVVRSDARVKSAHFESREVEMSTYKSDQEREPLTPEPEPVEPGTMPEEEEGETPPEPGTLPEEPDITVPEPEPERT